MKYQVLKVYNNNVVLAQEEDSQVILVSKGIGFGKKAGDSLEDNKSIEKVFHEINPKSKDVDLNEMDKVSINLGYLVKEIMGIAEDKLGKLNENSETTIHEHIEFALERLKMGLKIENPFLDEIITIYNNEYKVAGIARELIEKRVGVDIGDEEQGFIALHLYSARRNKSINETMKLTRIYKQCIHIIEEQCGVEIPLKTVESKQLFSNLRVFMREEKLRNMAKMPIKKYVIKYMPQTYKGAVEIANFLELQNNIKLSEDAIAYLTIDIEKLIQTI